MSKSGLGGRGRRCVAPGCERRVQPGAALCPRHRRTAYGEEVERGLRQLLMVTKEAEERREKAVEAFRRRVARGDYGELFDEPVAKRAKRRCGQRRRSGRGSAK